jgi:hypothetical protein
VTDVPITPQAGAGRLCILTNIYYKYLRVARLTHRLLDQFWPNHPRAFFCGIKADDAPDLPLFPLNHHLNDFAAILHDAVYRLRAAGYEQCYLILDEQMPLAPCHGEHLNKTLPALMTELNAAYIGLWGWDQKRHCAHGPVLDKTHYHLQRLPAAYAAKFSLHPALWRLDVLEGLLAFLLQKPELAAHSPWQFEHRGGSPNAEIPKEWKTSCYRVCGSAMALHPPGGPQKSAARMSCYLYGKIRALSYHFPNAAVRKWLWDAGGFDDIFFNGPYPMFFGGVMVKGAVNPHLVRWLEGQGKTDLLREIQQAAS